MGGAGFLGASQAQRHFHSRGVTGCPRPQKVFLLDLVLAMKTQELTDLHKEVFATWRFQIDSFWTRNTYFAGFQTAAVAGAVTVSEKHHWTGLFASLAALILAGIWFLSCDRLYEYQQFWWEKLIECDAVAFEAWHASPEVEGVRPVLLASDYERWWSDRDKRARWRHFRYKSLLSLAVVVFIAVWLGVVWYNLYMLQGMGLLQHPFKH